MSFNRTHTRAVIGLLTGHNTLRRHHYLLGLVDSPLCRKCGVMEETSAPILCKCEALASLRHADLGSFFLEPKDIQSISLGAIWSFSKASGLPWSDMGHKGLGLNPTYIVAVSSRTLIYTHIHAPKIKSDCALYLRSPCIETVLGSWSVKMMRLCEVSLVKIMCWLLYNCQCKGSAGIQKFLIAWHNY